MKPSVEPERYEPENPTYDVNSPPNDMPRTKDKVKGNVRLRWNHKISTNVSKYRIDKVAEKSFRSYSIEPEPVSLSVEQLRRKI